jgi:hypothetical protein
MAASFYRMDFFCASAETTFFKLRISSIRLSFYLLGGGFSGLGWVGLSSSIFSVLIGYNKLIN